MNKYFVIHSKDPFLSARLATELMMEGWNKRDVFKFQHPFDEDFKWLAIYGYKEFNFHNHRCYGHPTRLTLTASSYNNVIKEIIYGK